MVAGLRFLWFLTVCVEKCSCPTRWTTRRSRTHRSVAVRTGSQPVIMSADLELLKEHRKRQAAERLRAGDA